MGLDMYLCKRTYVKNWDYMRAEARHTVTITGPHAEAIKPSRIAYIEEEVGYWRKANAIHRWFVEHCQEGAYVEREQLVTLRDTCDTVLKNREQAMELLPPMAGFFFGSTDLDEGYWWTIEETRDLLTALLDEPYEDSSFHYCASW
jgi:hypothetical protein